MTYLWGWDTGIKDEIVSSLEKVILEHSGWSDSRFVCSVMDVSIIIFAVIEKSRLIEEKGRGGCPFLDVIDPVGSSNVHIDRLSQIGVLRRASSLRDR